MTAQIMAIREALSCHDATAPEDEILKAAAKLEEIEQDFGWSMAILGATQDKDLRVLAASHRRLAIDAIMEPFFVRAIRLAVSP